MAGKARTLTLNTKVNVTGADKLKGLERGLSGLGTTLLTRVSLPLVGLGVGLAKLADEAEQAQAKLGSTFKSMGAASFTTVKALNEQAQAMQDATTFDDEAITEAQAVLLTFGKVTGESFTRATEAALDMTSLFEGDLQAATIGIGKALNDPIKGVTALTRVGVSFTQQQKDQIKALAESGDLLGAQTIILAELEKQFGGTAEALAGTTGGQFKQAMNALADAGEEFGAILAPVFRDVAQGVKSLGKFLRDLNPETKEWIVRMAAIAAVAAPVVLITAKLVGAFRTLIGAGRAVVAFAPVMGASFHLMLGPLGLVTAGVAALAAAFATDFLGVRTRFEKDMGDIGDILGGAGDAFRDFFGIVEKGTGIEAMAESEKAGWAAFQDRIDGTITAAAGIVETGVTDMATEMGDLLPQAADALLANQFHLTDATTQLIEFMDQALAPAEEVFQARMFLASQAAADGLASGEPLVVQKTQELIDAANAVLEQHGKSAFNYGVTFTAQYAAGIVNNLGVIKDAGRQLASTLRRTVAIESEPSDHSSPLYGHMKWGGNLVRDFADSMLRAVPDVSSAAAVMGRAIGIGGIPGVGAMRTAAAAPSLRPSAVPIGAAGSVVYNTYNNFSFEGRLAGDELNKRSLTDLLQTLSFLSGNSRIYGG